MRDMKIGKKLIISFIVVALLAAVAGGVGLVVSWNTDTNYSEALISNGFSQGDIGVFSTTLNKGSATVRDIIVLTDAADLQNSQKQLEQITAQTTQALAQVKLTCQTPKELELLAVIDKNLPAYRQIRDQVVQLGLANRNDEALEVFRTQGEPLLLACTDAADALAELNVTLGNEVSADLSRQSRQAMVMIVVVIVGALALSIILGTTISRSISRPLQEIEDVAQAMSQGSVNVSLSYHSKNELGNLAQSMRVLANGVSNIVKDINHVLGQMADGNFRIDSQAEESYLGDYLPILNSMRHIISSLSSTLSQINQASDQVASGSDQVSSGAQALSQGATEQASSVEELAATINEISSQVKNNAGNAHEASSVANRVGSEITQSNQKMQDMITAMGEISQSSSEIGKIIKTIEDIAFQTNILALNAAVEAARAGAAGKGFAVVADEVRNLASKSAEASKNTSALIENALRAVQNGTQIADDTAQALVTAVEGAKDVTVIVDKISNASNEQAMAIAQVTQGIDQISSVVQTNSATAEESAAASEELSGQAQMLKSLVSQFQLKDSGNAVFTDTAVMSAAPHVSFDTRGSKY